MSKKKKGWKHNIRLIDLLGEDKEDSDISWNTWWEIDIPATGYVACILVSLCLGDTTDGALFSFVGLVNVHAFYQPLRLGLFCALFVYS